MASNEKGAVIPFGKYKGQPVEILQGDSDYLQWLLAQDWFRTRFASVYNVVINYSGEATETPEHNALQVLFLDDTFCTALLHHLEPGIDQQATQKLEERREEDIKWLRTSSYYYNDREQRQKRLAQISADFGPTKYHFKRAFEFSERPGHPPVDVVLDASFCACNGCSIVLPSLRIEIKPTVSDDYPAVLRQMKASRSNVLLLREYTGRGATREQFVLTLASTAIRVVFVDEISQ